MRHARMLAEPARAPQFRSTFFPVELSLPLCGSGTLPPERARRPRHVGGCRPIFVSCRALRALTWNAGGGSVCF